MCTTTGRVQECVYYWTLQYTGNYWRLLEITTCCNVVLQFFIPFIAAFLRARVLALSTRASSPRMVRRGFRAAGSTLREP